MKRRRSSGSSARSFVTVNSQPDPLLDHAPASLRRRVSPPPTNRENTQAQEQKQTQKQKSAAAAVEAGEVSVDDHIAFFSEKLLSARLPAILGRPQLDHAAWLELYRRNLQGTTQRHFVVHQHDHPVAGTHYDLRLQCNATSSISFAIMYGLPGDPNSRRLNRNATETRVHNLWNHLIETASHETGTMLIWDTGEYEVLPYYKQQGNKRSDDSDSGSEPESSTTTESIFSSLSEPDKLAYSFARRKIRLRLHGTRLAPGYTIGIRLTLDNDRAAQPQAPSFRRKRKQPQQGVSVSTLRRTSTSSSPSPTPSPTRNERPRRLRQTVSSLKRTESPPPPRLATASAEIVETQRDEPTANVESSPPTPPEPSPSENPETIRLTNAYPGATNSINSIHQRKWYLSLDRTLSGFVPIPTPKDVNHHAKTYWVRGECKDGRKTGFEKFHVLGRDMERSVVTGRLGSDILRDEGVEGYVPRGGWKGVTE